MTSLRSASAPAGGSAANKKTAQPGTVLFWGVLLVLLLSGLGLWFLPNRSLYLLAPLQVLLGSTIFIALIALIVLVFARLGLYDRGAALGLPDGSVRALIALILLIIFIIFANVIFGQLSERHVSRVASFSGLTATEVAALPGKVDTRREVPATAAQPATWEGTYVVTEPSQEAAALGAQVVTGLLTLVAAISAFYFGTGSVTAGAAAMRQARAPGGGGLRVLRPSQPVGLRPKDGGGYEPLPVELDGAALGPAGVTAAIVSNDDAGSIERGADDTLFVYTPGSTATQPVTLRFTSNEDSGATVDLVVRVPGEATVARGRVEAPSGGGPERDEAAEGGDDAGDVAGARHEGKPDSGETASAETDSVETASAETDSGETDLAETDQAEPATESEGEAGDDETGLAETDEAETEGGAGDGETDLAETDEGDGAAVEAPVADDAGRPPARRRTKPAADDAGRPPARRRTKPAADHDDDDTSG